MKIIHKQETKFRFLPKREGKYGKCNQVQGWGSKFENPPVTRINYKVTCKKCLKLMEKA